MSNSRRKEKRKEKKKSDYGVVWCLCTGWGPGALGVVRGNVMGKLGVSEIGVCPTKLDL
jgi:hypothetical protein